MVCVFCDFGVVSQQYSVTGLALLFSRGLLVGLPFGDFGRSSF